MASEVSPIPIRQYFVGERIFITGGTGFMGKVLFEKLLRCCPDVDKIYLIIRPKKNRSIEQRWDQMTKLELFDKLKSSRPDILKKVHLVPGDITKGNFGLSEENMEILREDVTIVYHVAAMIQFTDQLIEAINTNSKATHILLEMARSMRNLKVFVYVSTAYSNVHITCQKSVEEVLPAVQDWKVLLKLCDTEPLITACLKEKLMCGQANPYTFSKSIAEQIVNDYKCHFPTIIMRPSVVGPCIREDPIQGWTDILCGSAAISLPVFLGLARVIFSKDESQQDYIPVDVAINATILATAKRLREPLLGRTDVYNCGTGKEKPITSQVLCNVGEKLWNKVPSKHMIWVPHMIITSNELLYKILFILLNLFPALILDLFLCITLNKPMVTNLLKKFANVGRIFKKFSIGKFMFPNDRFKELENFLPEGERKNLSINIDNYSIYDMLEIVTKSSLKFYLKEDISETALKRNRRRLLWLKVLDKFVVFGFYGILALFMYRYFMKFDIYQYIPALPFSTKY